MLRHFVCHSTSTATTNPTDEKVAREYSRETYSQTPHYRSFAQLAQVVLYTCKCSTCRLNRVSAESLNAIFWSRQQNMPGTQKGPSPRLCVSLNTCMCSRFLLFETPPSLRKTREEAFRVDHQRVFWLERGRRI